MTLTGDGSAARPAAVSGVRVLLTQRLEDLEATALTLEQRLAQASESRDELRQRTQDNEVRWKALLEHLGELRPEELDHAFRSLSRFRADLAALEERRRDLSARLVDLRSEQDVLRAVYRSVDDMAAAVAPDEDSSRVHTASRQVFQIIEEERMRIARDVHDGPAQSMANLVLQAEILERLIQRDPQLVVRELVDFKAGVRAVLEDTRRLIFDLRPMSLDDLGLVPTLRKFVKEFGETAGVNAQLRVTGEDVRLPGSFEPTIYRIVQEALNNARKHARASNVEVLINFQPDTVTAVVRDDGVGMDVAAVDAALAGSKHLGLTSMRERASLEKGTLEIRSEAGRGTEVRAAFRL